MPLFGSKDKSSASQDPQVQQFEKIVAKEAHDDQKTLQHAVKDLKHAEASHNKGIKRSTSTQAADGAQHSFENAMKQEHKTADALNKATNQHDTAVSNQTSAEKTLNLKQQHEQRLQQNLDQRKQAMETIEQRKQANDQRREAKLSDLHAQAARENTGAGELHASNGDAPIANPDAAPVDPTGTGA
ncbi:hypothetical protein EUX98_g489 [Antrodiella citrinella]|uniref:Uncharacterized protein n=1 Tax=Antrodiella citrinella TaxID=2447956 RepID=A0A4S4N3V3_9APHY|nr:hypothetical protein EUX98_g489 [Antrodiella citrinella]